MSIRWTWTAEGKQQIKFWSAVSEGEFLHSPLFLCSCVFTGKAGVGPELTADSLAFTKIPRSTSCSNSGLCQKVLLQTWLTVHIPWIFFSLEHGVSLHWHRKDVELEVCWVQLNSSIVNHTYDAIYVLMDAHSSPRPQPQACLNIIFLTLTPSQWLGSTMLQTNRPKTGSHHSHPVCKKRGRYKQSQVQTQIWVGIFYF